MVIVVVFTAKYAKKNLLYISTRTHKFTALRWQSQPPAMLMPTAHAPGFLDPVSHKFQNGVKG